MQDMISVIIPAYNHEKYVQEAICSIIDQTYKNLELIIIDDGSVDKTWERIQELRDDCEKRFVNVYLETQDNQGSAITLNNLISRVKGDYVFIIASDDAALPDALTELHSFLSLNADYGLVVGDNEFIDENSGRAYFDLDNNLVTEHSNAAYDTFGEFLRHARKDVDFTGEQFGSYSSLLWGNYIPNGYLIRKRLLDNIGGFTKEAPLEDYYLMLQISKYSKMKYLEKVLYKYRRHSANISKQGTRMAEMTKRTIAYEKALVSRMDLKQVVPEALYAIQNGARSDIFKIPPVLELYRNRRIGSEQVVLKFLGMEFICRKHEYLE